MKGFEELFQCYMDSWCFPFVGCKYALRECLGRGFLDALLGMGLHLHCVVLGRRGLTFLVWELQPCSVWRLLFESVSPVGAWATCGIVEWCVRVVFLSKSLFLLFSLSWLTLWLRTLCWNNNDVFSNVLHKCFLQWTLQYFVLVYEKFCICHLQLHILKVATLDRYRCSSVCQ